NAGDILAAVKDAAAARRQKSADRGEQGRLAGAVRSDQSGDTPGLDIERDIVDGQQSAEALADAIDTEQRLSHGVAPAARISRRGNVAIPCDTSRQCRSGQKRR